MKNRSKAYLIMWYEAFGFLFIIVLSWLDEYLNLTYRTFGGVEEQPNWRESAMETIVVLAVWYIVSVFTRRLLARLYYLEGFVRVCAWCRKVGHEDEWLPLEQYFSRGFDIRFSHGVCPACADKILPEDTNSP